MISIRTTLSLAIGAFICVSSPGIAQDSYPITLKADDVYDIAELNVESNGLTISAKNVVVVPIHCERGITGAVLIGVGDFSFAPADSQPISGEFRAAMLRFDPVDQPKLLPLDKSKPTTDLAAHAMSQHLLNDIFRHCWHSGMNALIPDTGSFVVNVYSKTHGDLLISTGPKSSVAHNFSENKTLYSKK